MKVESCGECLGALFRCTVSGECNQQRRGGAERRAHLARNFVTIHGG